MSLYDDASLVMVPSGYKDTKLYSAKPTNGDGDFTFSRGSNLGATRINSEGLIEKGRENLLLQSNTFNTTWTTASTSVGSGQPDKDGGSTAWKLTKNGNAGYIQQSVSTSGVITQSIYAKAGTLDWIRISNSGFSNATTYYDLANGVLGTSLSDVIDASIEDLGNGWYRLTQVLNGSGSGIRIFPAIADNDVSGTGGYLYIQDAQLEQGLVATNYIETTTTTEQAGILEDMPRLDYSGGASCPSLLLEPQRSNSVLHSELISTYFFYTNASASNNATTSPEGVTNAASIIPDGTNGIHQIASSSISASGSFTLSAFVKAGELNKVAIRESNATGAYASFDLSTGTKIEDNVSGDAFIEPFENDWYRIGVTYTYSGNIRLGINVLSNSYTTGNPSSGATYWSSNGTDKLYVYGLQCELGVTYPTSYIPTYGSSSVTRSADELDLINWVSKGIISDSNEWTIFYEVDGLTTDYDTGDSQWLPGDDNTIDVYMRAGATNENFARFYWRKDSKYIGSTYGKKIIARLSGGTGTTFADGVEIASSSISGDYSNIGMNMGTSSNAAGYVKQAIIFPTALTDAECIELTTI